MATINTTTPDGKASIKVEAEPLNLVPDVPSIPSNQQIDSAISQAQNELAEQKPKLDSHGKKIVSSTQGVLDATSQLLNEKNKEERFQKLLRFTQAQAEGGPSTGLNRTVQDLMSQATGIGAKISDDATDALSYTRQTVYNLTISTEFRQLAVEFLDFLQSMLGELKGAVKETQNPADNQPLGQKIKNRVQYETDADRHDAINEKLSNLLEHISQQPEYQNVVRNFIKYSQQMYDALYRAKEDAKNTKEAEDLRKTVDEAWGILHDFTGKDSNLVPKFKVNLNALFEKIANDNQLAAWVKECQDVIIDSMENPENTKKNEERTKKMIHQGEGLSDKYRNDLNKLYNDASKIFNKIQSDPTIQNFQTQLEQLGRDIALNSKGQPDLFVMENSMSTIKNLLIERFRKVLIDVPIKRIQIRSESMDLLLTNISIQGTGLVPNHIHAKFTSETDIDLQKSPDAEQKFKMRLRVDQIKPHFKHVNFSYERKTFPTMSDNGVASLLFDGNGLSADIVVQLDVKSNRISRARLTTCSIKLESINLTIENAKHDVLDAILTPIFQAQVRTRLETGIQEYVQNNLISNIRQLNDWFRTKPFENLMRQGNETLQEVVEAGQRKAAQVQREQKSQQDTSLPWTSDKTKDPLGANQQGLKQTPSS